MDNYVIVSDSTLDLPAEYCEKLGVNVIPMEFTLDGKSYKHYVDERELSLSVFYSELSMGKLSTTSQINYKEFYNYFKSFFEQGKDIIYICFTSGLSGTYNTCLIAIADLAEKYPNRRIKVINSLCASIGEGVLVYNAAVKAQEGLDFDDLCAWIEENKTSVCHWFVVDDLEHLKRGGRISPVAATFGKALQIKPLLTVDFEGKLQTVSKIRGANKVFDTLVSRLVNDGRNTEEQTVIIGNADCIEDAERLKKLLLDNKLAKNVIIAGIGPIIGTHVGKGMLALAFLGERKIK